MDRKSLRGTLKLIQAGTEEDAAIEGSINLEIWENRGLRPGTLIFIL